jgi:hypothetical protein
MNARRYTLLGGLLLAVALAACGPSAGVQTPTAMPDTPAATTAATAEPTLAPTEAPQPTLAPTEAPTAVLQATSAPTAAADQTPPPPTSALPNDVPWFRLGQGIHGDDEAIDFDKYSLPRPAFNVQAAPDGAYIAYMTEQGKLTVIDSQRFASLIGPDESIGEVIGYTFSPDSRSLALTVVNGDNSWSLQTRDIATGTTQTVISGQLHPTSANDPLPLAIRPIAWTAAGLVADHVLWASDAPPRDLGVVNLADGSTRLLREGDHVDIYASRDGAKVAIVTGRLGMGEPPQTGLAILDVASGQEQEIVPIAQRLFRQVRWSPDATKLLYADTDNYQSSTVWARIVNADGTDEQEIAVGSQAVQLTYADVAWLDNQTALLLSADGDNFRLDRVPVADFKPSSILTIAAGPRDQADTTAMQIIYTPQA